MFEFNQNESSAWTLDSLSSDSNGQALYREIQNSMTDPRMWNALRNDLNNNHSDALDQFPSAESLFGAPIEAFRPETFQVNFHESQPNLLETALKAPALLMDTWKEVTGLKMAEEMILSVLQNPEAMKLAVMAVQTGMFI